MVKKMRVQCVSQGNRTHKRGFVGRINGIACIGNGFLHQES